MSLNPIQKASESTQSTPTNNSLSTSSSSASSLSQIHQAPISTSLPRTWRTSPSFSNRSGFTSSSSSSLMTQNSQLNPHLPLMERSNSASTMNSYFFPVHEKSLSTDSIQVNLSPPTLPQTTYTPSIISTTHSKLYDSVNTKDLERIDQLGPHDTWGSLVVKVLPLFNGEGLKLCIEDLNDLVRRYMNDRPLHLLYDDINELLELGMFTLNGKLRGVPDEKLVSRLVELWSFFFGTVIPYFEGVFLPLLIQSSAQKENMNIRRLVLMSFRDHVILPMGDRVEDAFNKLFHDFDSGIPVTDTAARMLQMSYILSSILSDDDKQRDMDRILGKLKNNWKLFMRRRDRRGFVGMSPSNSNTNNSAAQSTIVETTEEEKSTFPVDFNETEISNTVTTPTTAANLIDGVSATTSPAY
ncbi:HbrB-domain-containing protein [Rhizophagus clarus]|uniref:HbrB-domain-containing protein n=1 Tax=Rhizophagus clarus TaxID=94130 RepID=A0A8H3KWW2_9GLOM|nr:HbrB-domain-containing protein [Rhizophagus clarus]